MPRGRCPTTSCRPRAGAAWAVGAAIAVLASACAHFTPSVPMRARSADVELELQHLRTGARRELTFATRSTVPHTIRRGWLTVATRDPCTGGADVASIAIDDGAIADGVLPPGSHQLSVRFDDGLNDYTLDVVVDLAVDDGGCLRAPAVSQAIPLAAESRTVIVGGLGLVGNADISGLRAVYDFNAGVGRWVGPTLLTAQLGVGGAICNEGTCGRDGDGNLKSGLALPFALEGRYAFGTAGMGKLVNVGFIGARYSYSPVTLPAFDGERRFGVHAFQGVLAWGFMDNLLGPFRHLERATSYDFAVPVGVMFDQGAPSHRVVFVAGMEMRFVFQL